MRLIPTIFSLLIGLSCQASDWWTTQAGQGIQDGSPGNEHAMTWLNNSANWGSGGSQVKPGDTVHLSGTITSPLTAQGSGTLASPITIHFESGAQMSAPTLSSYAVWINLDNQSNIVVDGGVNGVIQLTDNGTIAANHGTMDYDNSGISGVHAYPGDNIVVKNLIISNLYNRQTNSDPVQGVTVDANAIYWAGGGLTVSNCVLTGCQEM